MKKKYHISQLMLEQYHLGEVSLKERKLVEKAISSDREVYRRYEEIKKSDEELSIRYPLENLPKLYEIRNTVVPVSFTAKTQRKTSARSWSATPSPRKKTAVWIIAAAVLLCAIIPAVLYLKNSVSKKDNAITEETTHETNPEEEAAAFIPVLDIPNEKIAVSPEPPAVRKRGNSGGRAEIADTPHTEPVRPAEPELRLDPASGVSVAVTPQDTGVRMRGQDQSEPPETTSVPEETPNINIPPGFTFIFENMFAERNLTFVIIPSRIRSIGGNAFAGNPLLSVTIGADVSIEDSAIPGNFAAVYNSGGRAAGTYTRPDLNSEEWEKK